MSALSNGGTDAVVYREFDPVAKRFLDDGFNLGEAKAEAAYIDANTILFSTDFGPGTLTASGYPRIVKMWRRGQTLAEAKTVFEGQAPGRARVARRLPGSRRVRRAADLALAQLLRQRIFGARR